MRGRSVTIALVLCGVTTLSAQTPKPAFDVAAVRRNVSKSFKIDFDFQESRFVATNMPLRALIAVAYGAEGREPNLDRIVGGPSWVDSATFDIQATTGGRPTPRAAMRLMLQTLLEERFGLRMRTEQRDLPSYALLLNRDDGRLGPQLKPAATKNCSNLTFEQATERRCGSGVYFDKDRQVTVVYGSDVVIDALMDNIAGPAVAALDRPVVNRTGLGGRFDYELRFSNAAGRVDASPAASPSSPGTPVFTAMREQLGLRFDPVTAPVEVLVIDAVQQPAEN